MSGYKPTEWVSGTTPLSAGNLNKMENGIRSAMPTGAVIVSYREDAPPGFLTLDGAEVSRSANQSLFDYVVEHDLIGAGKPFGNGDGSTTFVLPDESNRTQLTQLTPSMSFHIAL